jgi:hypothetical protein
MDSFLSKQALSMFFEYKAYITPSSINLLFSWYKYIYIANTLLIWRHATLLTHSLTHSIKKYLRLFICILQVWMLQVQVML